MKTQRHIPHAHSRPHSHSLGLIKTLDSETPGIAIVKPQVVFSTFIQAYYSQLIHWFTNTTINIHELRKERALKTQTRLDSAYPTERQSAHSAESLKRANPNESNYVHPINCCHSRSCAWASFTSYLYFTGGTMNHHLMRRFAVLLQLSLSEGTMNAIQWRSVWVHYDLNHIEIFWKCLKSTHLFIPRNLAVLKWIHHDC